MSDGNWLADLDPDQIRGGAIALGLIVIIVILVMLRRVFRGDDPRHKK